VLVKKVLLWHRVATFLAAFILIYGDKQFITLIAYPAIFFVGSQNISTDKTALWNGQINQFAGKTPNGARQSHLITLLMQQL
jgi:hypothetical protein